jgi:phosphoglycerate dehydrogenase-like enzyme
MSTAPLADREAVTVGLVYPLAGESRPPELLAREVAALEAIDPRIRVLTVGYEESHELRTARGTPPYDGLRERAPELTPEQREMFAAVDVVLALDLPFDIGSVAPNLSMVHGVGVGSGQLVSAGLAGAGVRLVTASGVSGVSIAEFAVGRLLEFWKRFGTMAERQAERRWESLYGKEVAGTTVAVLGLGAIGSNVAKRLKAFDVTVLSTRRSYRPGMTAEHVDELFGPGDLHQVLRRADAVIAAVPETPETVDTMDAAAFAAMKPGAFFCNVGRGSFVVEEALLDALTSGHLGGAALDVFRTEPLPADSPLWDAPNLVVSAHASASVERYFDNLAALFRANLARFLAGEPIPNEVDPATGY